MFDRMAKMLDRIATVVGMLGFIVIGVGCAEATKITINTAAVVMGMIFIAAAWFMGQMVDVVRLNKREARLKKTRARGKIERIDRGGVTYLTRTGGE